MENNSSFHVQKCVSSNVGTFVSGLTIITLPFHFLVIKVLIVDLRLALPRHNTMLCLSVSDTLQVFMLFLCMAIPNLLNFSRESVGCDVLRTIVYFHIALTLVVSSLSAIALSMERYVACIHSFHLHRIFTSKRMACGISSVWILGFICGGITAPMTIFDRKMLSISDNTFMKTISVLFIIPTSIIICIIQCRLLVFSRKKMIQVGPGAQFGCKAELFDFRKKQLKVTFVASIVVVAYIACMLPTGCFSFYELLMGRSSNSMLRGIVEKLLLLNNFADPFIYGMGTVDARKHVFKNLRKIRDFFRRQSHK